MKSELGQLQSMLGKAGVSSNNICGAVAYYDKGSAKPWRISDDHASDSYATFEEAKKDVASWIAALE